MSILSFFIYLATSVLSCYVCLILLCLSYLVMSVLSCYVSLIFCPVTQLVCRSRRTSPCTLFCTSQHALLRKSAAKVLLFFHSCKKLGNFFCAASFPSAISPLCLHHLSAISPLSLRHASAISPLCLHHLSAMPPLSITAKRRQKDGKRTAKGRQQKQREAGENPDSSTVSACFMLTTTISPPRLRIYNSTAAQHKSLLLSDTTKTAFASNF